MLPSKNKVIIIIIIIIINWRHDHETLDCTASWESESTRKLFTCHCYNFDVLP